MDNISVIYKLNPAVVRTVGETAYDVNGDEVAYDRNAVLAYVDAHSYIAKRVSEYPPMTDYLDGVVQGDQAQVQAYINTCLAVKAKYPKRAI